MKSYLRHGPTQAFGLVCSAASNSIYDGKLAYVPALEDVLVWDVKKGQQLAMWHETSHRAEVTVIAQSPQKDTFAVGYTDGSVRLWSAASGTVMTTLNGHTKAITALVFDDAGAKLASGSQDTTIILWDIIGEMGLFRLRGHRDMITALRFLGTDRKDSPSTTTQSISSSFLLSSSKDTFLKLWDLSTRHCVQTVVAHRAEIWSFDINQTQDTIFTGSTEGEVKAWRIDWEVMEEGLKEDESGEMTKMISFVSTLPLSSRHRVSQISFHSTKPYLAIQSHDRSVEIFRVRTEEEIRKKEIRRKKRAKEKKEKARLQDDGKKNLDTNAEANDEADEGKIQLVDMFTPYLVVRANGKIRSFDFANDDANAKGGVHLLMALATNALEVFHVPQPTKTKEVAPEATRFYSLDLPGHRTDVRTLSLSSDDELLASASNGSLKIWNMRTTACIRTMDCGYALCSAFLPGDKYVAVGTKSGEILLYDLAASAMVETISAHNGAVWSMHVSPDERGLVTGSADKDVKFWEFEHKIVEGGAKLLSFAHVRTLKMTDDVLSVRYSPNGKLLAVSLLDSTVKVFYQDTLKFFLSLYGHKLPVLSMDISVDSKLIVTGSADKNVKIWGLDFGDCHKSIFAHEESIMQVAFERERGSHYFWTVGKDKHVKYWDGDKFENIQRLEGHHGEIWALAVSNHGKLVVTGSHDKSIRVWEKLDEPLFLEEERERELEALHESNIADLLNQTDQQAGEGGFAGAEATPVGKQTTETLIAGERIVEALDLSDAERAKPPDAPRNTVLTTLDQSPEEYVLRVVEKISSTALNDALLVLPFDKVLSLMVYLSEWAQKDWNIALVSRIMFFLLRAHHNQIATNRAMRGALIPLRKHLRAALRRQQEILGYNLAALQFIKRREETRRTTNLYEKEEEMDEEKVKEKIAASSGKKRKRVKV